MMPEFNDPFLVWRMIFTINFKKFKITKFCEIVLIVIYALVHCLLLYYTFTNFSANLLIRYGPVMIFYIFMIAATTFSIALEAELSEVITFLDEICWPLNMIAEDAQVKLQRKCRIINMCIAFLVLIILSAIIVNYPFFGDQRDFFICVRVFEEYFGEWSFIPYYFYFAASPFFYYNYFKLCFTFVYAVLEAGLQFFLIEGYLLQTYKVDYLKRWKCLKDNRYQQELGKSLRLCIVHHIALKKLVKMIVNLTVNGMPIFLLLGSLLYISCFTFTINLVNSLTNILKTRIILMGASCVGVTVLLCWNGQQIIDVTSSIFTTLVGAPWYFWNLDNIKILLMFITNCTKNDKIVLAGICLDYKLFASILRISFSYALVLFNLRKASVS
ncbi:odorant receptor 259 [Tribolium castaneum]|uniref:Odorant receptor n=1 Tax=Tribolium castaneum TaxID=7070 RepID=D6WFW6_TRICA|nr:odorant receptor 259 [Tribolium castaneum]